MVHEPPSAGTKSTGVARLIGVATGLRALLALMKARPIGTGRARAAKIRSTRPSFALDLREIMKDQIAPKTKKLFQKPRVIVVSRFAQRTAAASS
jgi:hypothetical protein